MTMHLATLGGSTTTPSTCFSTSSSSSTSSLKSPIAFHGKISGFIPPCIPRTNIPDYSFNKKAQNQLLSPRLQGEFTNANWNDISQQHGLWAAVKTAKGTNEDYTYTEHVMGSATSLFSSSKMPGSVIDVSTNSNSNSPNEGVNDNTAMDKDSDSVFRQGILKSLKTFLRTPIPGVTPQMPIGQPLALLLPGLLLTTPITAALLVLLFGCISFTMRIVVLLWNDNAYYIHFTKSDKLLSMDQAFRILDVAAGLGAILTADLLETQIRHCPADSTMAAMAFGLCVILGYLESWVVHNREQAMEVWNLFSWPRRILESSISSKT